MDWLTVVAYLALALLTAVWFWRLIRSTGHPVNLALILLSLVFGGLWPIVMPGVTVYRWLLRRGLADIPDMKVTP